MFKKLLSNLPFNPSLISQVSFYSKRLHRESSIRRMGVVFVVLSMFVQMFAVVFPSEPTLASSSNDVYRGGFTSQAHAVRACKNNEQQFRTIINYFDVDCKRLEDGKMRRINYNEYGGQLYSMGRLPYGFSGEVGVNIPGAGLLYMRPLTAWGQHCVEDGRGCMALTGTRANGTPFMILMSCGNITIVGPPVEKVKAVTCEALTLNVRSGSRVELGTSITVKGKANGKNLAPGERADFLYEVVRGGTVRDRQNAKGVAFRSGTAEDSRSRGFVLREAGTYTFRLTVKYDGGSKDAGGSRVGNCAKVVHVNTPPPQEVPEKVIECSALLGSFTSGQTVVAGTSVAIWGQASGRHLPNNQKVSMQYDFLDENNQVLGSSEQNGIAFSNSIAEDSERHFFTLNETGTYNFHLTVRYDNKQANGSKTGSCVRTIEVEPPCEDSENNEITECIILSKKAQNQTADIDDANGTQASAGDVIVYTLIAKNTSGNTKIEDFVFEENMGDVLEYADIVDLHGGEINDNFLVTWPPVDIEPEQSVEQTITIRVKDPIPQTPVAASNPGSYDLTMTNVYGNTVEIELPPSVPKTTEQVVTTLPETGPGETLAVAAVVTVVASYFFARSQLMSKELDIVRTEYATVGGR